MYRLGQRDIGHHIDEHLGLEAETYDGKRRNTTRISPFRAVIVKGWNMVYR
jgi:hypothetical protein